MKAQVVAVALLGFPIVIFFSLTEAPLPDPTQQTQNGPETDPKQTRNRAETEPNGAGRSRNEPKSSPLGWDSQGVCRGGEGGGVVREKENH